MRCVVGCTRVFLSATSDQFLCPVSFLYDNNMVIEKRISFTFCFIFSFSLCIIIAEINIEILWLVQRPAFLCG